MAGANRPWQTCAADHVDDDRVTRSQVRQNQVLVEGGLQNARVGNPKNGVRLLDVVGKPHSRLQLPIVDDPAIPITAQSQIKGPVPYTDRVLQVEPELLNVRMAAERKKRALRACATILRLRCRC